jgi:FMN phosphatase YigB (HAD superfamily)
MMIKAILLDLDNTLLHNPDKPFAQAFLAGVASHFQRLHGYEDAAKSHRESLKGLADAHNGTESNAARMAASFQRLTSLSPDEARTAWDSFYSEIYPTLMPSCIQPVSGAADLIQTLREAGFALVIASNPIYPEAAILARMAQAGLPTETGTYALVTGAELMHFPKTNPAYYAEILGRIGVEPDEALMVGDSETNDILPAHTIGMHTFHITPDYSEPVQGGFNGTLEDFSMLIHNPEWMRRFPTLPLRAEMIAPQYYGNIGALFGMLENVQADYWHKRPDPNEWSILQILCHLVESEERDQRPRLERILREDNPFIVAPHPSGPNLPVCDDDGMRVAQKFVHARKQTLDFIATLQPEDWQRPARHSVFGLTTLVEMAHFTAQHDRLHLNQLCQTIGRCVSFS